MSQAAPAAKADAHARPDKPVEDDNDFYGTDTYFGRHHFFSDQPAEDDDKEDNA